MFSSTHVGGPLAIVLGVNEIASGVAVSLHNAGYAVIMAHDPARPVIRRGMAFFDALFDGNSTLGGITATSVDTTLAARLQARARERISVTRLDLSELLIVGDIEALVDARMSAEVATPQLRKLARFAIGIGSGFASGEDCDAVVQARGSGDEQGDAGRRMLTMRSPVGGRWHTPLDIGVRIYKGFPLGYLGATVIKSPVDGVLRGIARDDTTVPAGAELVEISARGTGGLWWGLDARGMVIGEEVLRALRSLGATGAVASSGARLRLVHSR